MVDPQLSYMLTGDTPLTGGKIKGYYKNDLKIMFGAWESQMSGLEGKVIPNNFKWHVGKRN